MSKTGSLYQDVPHLYRYEAAAALHFDFVVILPFVGSAGGDGDISALDWYLRVQQ